MLSKLMKYDFKATSKFFVPCSIFILLYSCVATLFFNFSTITGKMNSSISFTLLITLLTVFYAGILIAYVLGTYAISIVHFYKSMVTDQGYLTHTLPVKKSKIILGKFLTANILCLIGAIIAGLSAIIYFDIPSILSNLNLDYAKIWSTIYPEIGPVGIILTIISCFLGFMTNIAMFYLAIALGQLVNKHKALGSILFFFALLFVYQIIATFFGFFFLDSNAKILYENSSGFFSTTGAYTLTMILGIVSSIVVTAIQLFITHFIFQKKLNLD